MIRHRSTLEDLAGSLTRNTPTLVKHLLVAGTLLFVAYNAYQDFKDYRSFLSTYTARVREAYHVE